MDWGLYISFGIAFILLVFFSGIEMAFFSASRLNIELKRKQGGATGKLLGKFVDTPAIFLGTTIICSTLALTCFVLLSVHVLKPLWQVLQLEVSAWRVMLAIAINVFVILIFVEFIPRAIFRARSNVLLSRLAYVFNFFYSVFYPFTAAFFQLCNWVLKYVFAVRLDGNKSPLSRNDLRFLFQDNVREGHTENSTQLLENAQELSNRRIRECLVPRKEIIGIEKSANIETLVAKFTETKRTRIIVYQENIDNIIGYVHELDLFKKPTDITSILLEIPAVPESMSAVDLINKFGREAKSIAWVVDEFGGTAGIVTMEDVLEELFGEIWDEYDTERFVEKQIAEDEYLFSGRLELDYIEKKYRLEFEGDDSETLSGYIINYHETIPRQKDRIIIGDYEFDIVDVSDTRIEMVKLKKLK